MAAPTEIMEVDGLSEEIMIKLCEIFKISSLHDHQKIAIESALLRKEDSIICVPTGGGKSLCFEAIVPCCKLLMDDTLTPAMVIVVSPLLSLMGTQIQSLRELNFEAVAVNDPDFDIIKFKDCKYK